MSASAVIAVSPLRLTALRAYYGLMAVGSFAVFWPDLLRHSAQDGITHGAQFALLSALAPLALLGIRYPVQMLPLVLYEFLWKALWFVFVASPLYRADAMTELVWSNVFACGIAIVLTPIIMPWRAFWALYVTAPSEPWWR